GSLKKNKFELKANHAFNGKRTKYKQLFAQIVDPNLKDQLTIIPLIFETSGLINKDSLQFIKDMALQAEWKEDISHLHLEKYFLRRLSVCLQKSLAKTINSRYYRSLGS